MKYLLFLLLAGCSVFHDDESVTVHKPQEGTKVTIEQDATVK